MTQRHDLVIRGGEAVLPGQGVVACDIAVRDGRISAILGAGEACDAAEELSAHGLTILPGVIDAHIHLGHGQDVSRPRVPEDAAVESGAAAAGGITCFVPYLLSTQPYEEVFDEVTTVTAAGSRVDFGYHLVISTEKHLDSIGEYVEQLGVTSFKFFMNTRGGKAPASACRTSMTACSIAFARQRRATAEWSARIRRTWRSPGCCAIASRLWTRTVGAGWRVGTAPVLLWWRRKPCSERL